MHSTDLTGLISKTAALMEQFERNCETLRQQQEQLTRRLDMLAQQLPATARQSADEAMHAIAASASTRLLDGLGRPMDTFERRLQQSGRQLAEGADTLAAQFQRIERLHRGLVWKLLLVSWGGLALLLAGGGWLLWQYRQDIVRHQLAADLLRAYDQADVTLCEGRLCANVDERGKRYGDRQQYRPVEPRP